MGSGGRGKTVDNFTQEEVAMGGRKGIKIIRTFFSIILSLLLAVIIFLFLLFLFARALNETVSFPSFGPVSGDLLAEILGEWYSMTFGVTAVMIPLLLIVLFNLSYIRRAFAFVGVSAIMAALFSAAFSFVSSEAIRSLSGEWQEALLNSRTVLKSFFAVWAVVMAAVGTFCISVYSCISVVKGVKG